MKILFLSHLVPWPTNTGGKQILYNQIKGLSASHDVSMICFRHPDYSEDGGLSGFCKSLMILDIPRTRKVLLNAIVGLVRFVPLTVSLYASRKHSATIREHLDRESYDVVISRIEMVQFIPASYKGPMILLMEDPEPLKFTRLDKRGWKIHQRIFHWFESWRLSSYERRQSPRFDRVTLISEEDVRDNQAFMPDARLACVPYGTDPDWFSPSDEVKRVDGMIVFSGNMYQALNAAGAIIFCREFFPLIKKEVPGASLWIVGANPTPEILQWGQTEGITVTGAVPEIRDYLRMARVSICPISLKIGVQTKVLEAMACGTPVVSTSAGNSGIQAVSGKGLYVADSPPEFSARVVSLLKGENWDEMSASARRFVLDHFSWRKSVGKMEKLISDILIDHKKSSLHN
jgi:glycosyltransferase involved in cell wall biosynthesis